MIENNHSEKKQSLFSNFKGSELVLLALSFLSISLILFVVISFFLTNLKTSQGISLFLSGFSMLFISISLISIVAYRLGLMRQIIAKLSRVSTLVSILCVLFILLYALFGKSINFIFWYVALALLFATYLGRHLYELYKSKFSFSLWDISSGGFLFVIFIVLVLRQSLLEGQIYFGFFTLLTLAVSIISLKWFKNRTIYQIYFSLALMSLLMTIFLVFRNIFSVRTESLYLVLSVSTLLITISSFANKYIGHMKFAHVLQNFNLPSIPLLMVVVFTQQYEIYNLEIFTLLLLSSCYFANYFFLNYHHDNDLRPVYKWIRRFNLWMGIALSVYLIYFIIVNIK